MAKINLLPWREARRKQRQQDFVVSIGIGAAVTCFALLGVYLYIEGLKEYQVRRNQFLKEQIAIVDKKIEEIKEIEDRKNKLLVKIQVIQELQASRPGAVHLFDELAKITPEGIRLNRLTQTGSGLTLEGKADSNARVSAYMRAMENSVWINSPVLGVIKGLENKDKKQISSNDFTLKARQGKPPGEKDQKAGAKK